MVSGSGPLAISAVIASQLMLTWPEWLSCLVASWFQQLAAQLPSYRESPGWKKTGGDLREVIQLDREMISDQK
jgi:hypothetical protein